MSMVVLAVVLALYFAVPVLAQDMPAKEEKKAMVKQHAKTHHNMKLSDKDVKSKITDVPAK